MSLIGRAAVNKNSKAWATLNMGFLLVMTIAVVKVIYFVLYTGIDRMILVSLEIAKSNLINKIRTKLPRFFLSKFEV